MGEAGDGSIRVVPVALDPIDACRGYGGGGGTALLALRDNEEGAERVASLLREALSGESRCLVCFVSRMQLLYRVRNDQGEGKARLPDPQLQSLPIAWVGCSDLPPD